MISLLRHLQVPRHRRHIGPSPRSRSASRSLRMICSGVCRRLAIVMIVPSPTIVGNGLSPRVDQFPGSGQFFPLPFGEGENESAGGCSNRCIRPAAGGHNGFEAIVQRIRADEPPRDTPAKLPPYPKRWRVTMAQQSRRTGHPTMPWLTHQVSASQAARANLLLTRPSGRIVFLRHSDFVYVAALRVAQAGIDLSGLPATH
jgi:hypothetical protein